MALSPTDFYAYSRATGTPFPEDAEERAQMAPEVLEFRRNQLKSKDEDFNVTNALGTVAALAGIGAGGFGLTRLLGRKTPIKKVYAPPAEAAPVIEKISMTGVPPSKTVEKPTFTPRSYVEETGSVSSDLTSIQDQLDPLITKQAVEASDPGLDQVINRGVIIPSQRKVTGFRAFSENADRIERVFNEIQDFSQELTNIDIVNKPLIRRQGRLISREEGLKRGPTKVSSPYVLKTFNPYGITEEDFEILGERGTQELERAYERGGRSVSDLTGEIKVDPKIGRQLRKEGTVVRPGSVLQLSQFSDTPTREGVGVNRFTPNEILERTMAAASYPREIRDQILNPNVSREEIREFLGSTPKVRGGAVSINPTMEIAGGARASMPEAFVDELQTTGVGGVGLTYADTTNLPGLGQKEKLERAGFVFDPNTGNYVQTIDDMEFEPDFLEGGFFNENATDYGDTEGVGNLLIPTETFKERTNKSTTLIPGTVESVRGLVGRTGTERQERVIDAVIPFRKDVDSEQTTGLRVQADPESSFERQLGLRDIGYKRGGIISSEDTLTQGTTLVGGFEPEATKTPAINIDLNDLEVVKTDYGSFFKLKPGVTKREPSFNFDPASGIINIQPFMEDRIETITEINPITKQPSKAVFKINDVAAYGPLLNKKGQPTSVDRNLLIELASDANNIYYSGGKLVTGNPLEKSGFVADYINQKLLDLDIDLPVLRDIKAKHRFVADVTNTTKDVTVYARRQTGLNQYGYPEYAKEAEPLPTVVKVTRERGGEQQEMFVSGPPQTQTKGLGGVSPMLVEESAGYDVPVSYYSPRIDTISQRKLLGILQKSNVEAGAAVGLGPSTQTGVDMTRLRGAMETPSTGEGMRRVNVRNPQTGNVVGKVNVPTMNIGSFARTQNPYTGVAAAAAGPASRASEGNYQYTSNQLNPNLASTSQLPLAGTGIRRLTPEQIDELNQFALTANLTPGGYVRQGALRLGRGDAPILSGVGPLSEGETIQRYGITGSNLAQFGNALMRQAALDKMIVTPQGRRGKPPGPTSVRNKLRKNTNGDLVF